MQARAIGLAAAIFLALAVASSAAGWRTYVNERFGATADVPAGWRAGNPPENGDGLDFTSPDGSATIIVFGGLNIWDTIAEGMADFATPGDGETIVYKHEERRAIVVSGTKGDRIFYRKSILTCRDQIWDSVSIEYRAADKLLFDPLVARVAKSLRGGESAQVPGCL